jgi:hypothetical protein
LTEMMAYIFATIVTVPLLGLIMTYVATLKLTGDRAAAFRFSADISTVLFMISVYYIMYEIWETSFLWLIIIVFLSTAILFSFLQWKLTEDVRLKKVMKGTWRFNFLIFSAAYLILFTYGLINRLSELL